MMHPIEIQWMRFDAFYNARGRGFILSVRSRSNGHDLTVTIRDLVFHQSG